MQRRWWNLPDENQDLVAIHLELEMATDCSSLQDIKILQTVLATLGDRCRVTVWSTSMSHGICISDAEQDPGRRLGLTDALFILALLDTRRRDASDQTDGDYVSEDTDEGR